MLEPTESTTGEPLEGGSAPESGAETTPSDTLPPRRRRRAASRPAGPPGSDAAADPAAVVEPKPTAEASPAEPSPAEAPAAEQAPQPEEKPARTRRRATRKVSAPAGAPQTNEAEPSATAPESERQEPAAAAKAEPAEKPASDAEAEQAPARQRRRSSRKASAPAGAPQGEPEQQPEPAADDQPKSAPAKAAKSKRGSAKSEQPEADQPKDDQAKADQPKRKPAKSKQAQPEPSQSEQPEPEQPAAEEEPAPKRTRRRTAKSAAEPAAEAAAEQPEEPARTARKPKAEKRAKASAESGSEKKETEAPKRGRAGTPPVAMFQAPVFTEPAFQTPQRAAAAAAAAAEQGDAEEEEPQAGTRRRRRVESPGGSADAGSAEVVAEEEPEETDESEESEQESSERPARRRRRGGRRRRKGDGGEGASEEESPEPPHDEDEQEAPEDAEAGESDEGDEQPLSGSSSSSSRRRRRRRRRTGEQEPAAEQQPSTEGDPERTVVKVREPRKKNGKEGEPSDEVQAIKGSTRLEAKKQRRREGREQGRRRVPIITEAEFLARREAVKREMIVRQSGERTQIGILEDDILVEHFVNKEQATSYVGNVYLGKVQNVLPSMEAAFVDIGKGRNAVLYAGEVNFEALGMGGGPRRIEAALKSGQSVLVQVTKDPIGHKGARLTSQVSLPGRYLVYVPEGSMTGISRKLPDTERSRLKQILKKVVPEDAGVIVRTAAEGASEDELRRDVERLQGQWEEIKKKSGKGTAPTLLYGEPDMTVRVVRDIFNEDFSKVIVSGEEAWQTVHGYVEQVAPDLVDRLQKWTSDVDVFATYRVDEQLTKALDRKVWLPSGGSLVIDRTEAMIVVDVNTGKFTGQGGNLEETVTRNNLEAAEEIVRQLRLRDLGGIIVIDFIDMVLESNRDLVLRRLLECLGRDRTKHQVAEVTSLGLVQMTRKRVGQGLLESFSETCPQCNGRGVLVHMELGQPAGGKKGKKKKGGGHQHDHVHEETAGQKPETKQKPEAEPQQPEGGRQVEEPVPFVPDEELYGSAAEAEAAASGRQRTRKRGGRRASAPQGAPGGEGEQAEPQPQPEPEQPQAEAESAAAEPREQGTAKARTRRRAVRRATAPAGAPEQASRVEGAEPEPSATPAVPEPASEPALPVEATPVPEPEPRPRRRAARKASAPAGSPHAADDAAVTVIPAGEQESAAGPQSPEPAQQPVSDAAPARRRRRVVREFSAPEEQPVSQSAAEPEVPAKKTARKAAAKKATAKKAAAKKTAKSASPSPEKPEAESEAAAKKSARKAAAKKSAAKKTTAKKAAVKKTAAKKTAAADEQSPSSVTVQAGDEPTAAE
ncbi:Rne/Rng family ribonuclease [Streptomyces sulphureus]|uniref:Rne/Rng family ribonuclease n=1 Tax=Streptomyces sulphureus TaxID=47758 RepID=UPI0003810645|nr:Rne/Rng family ribonuclease [Streptomyces sulphureus]